MKPTRLDAWQRLGAQLHDAARAARHVADGQAAHTVPSHAHPTQASTVSVPGVSPSGSAHDDDMSRTAARPPAWYQRTFHGRADQVARVRREIAAHLAACPAAADAVLIASELAANSVMFSQSQGEFFTIRCEAYPDYVWIEVEDLGGPWHCKPPGDRPHGLDIVGVLARPDNWGTETTSDGNRIVWARLNLPREGRDT